MKEESPIRLQNNLNSIDEVHTITKLQDVNTDLMEEEIWKDVEGYEGFYQVSNMGRVRSLDRVIVESGGKIKNKKGLILKQTYDKNGYLGVNLTVNKAVKRFKTHRLVMSNFLGDSELAVDHINEIKDDNRLINLRYCTTRENIHFFRKGKSQFVGVNKEEYGWRASIKIEGVSYYMGMYEDPIEAKEVYDKALNKWVDYNIKPEKYIKIIKKVK